MPKTSDKRKAKTFRRDLTGGLPYRTFLNGGQTVDGRRRMNTEDRISGYFRSLSSGLPPYLRALEKEACLEQVPIIRRQTQEFLRFYLKAARPKRILELGTAVGFSACLMAEYMPSEARLITVEKVPVRIVAAKKNLAASPYADRIEMLTGDALAVLKALCKEPVLQNIGIFTPGRSPADQGRAFAGYECRNIRPDGWLDGIFVWEPQGFRQFDLIFLDAAKAQYPSYLPYLIRLLAKDAVLITDNILQEGSVAESKFSIARRDRTIHMRMREYLYTITHCRSLDTILLRDGDGMAVSRRTGEEDMFHEQEEAGASDAGRKS